jgi:hypothetical protein
MKNPDCAKELVETCSTHSCNQRGVNELRNAVSRVSVSDSGQTEFFITLLARKMLVFEPLLNWERRRRDGAE